MNLKKVKGKNLSQSPNTLKGHVQLVSHMVEKSHIGEQITHTWTRQTTKEITSFSFVPRE